MLHFVENTEQIIENIKTFEHYLVSEHEEERLFAINLIKKERSMVIYRVRGENHFAPIKFLGFKKNSKSAYIDNEKKETRDTIPTINSLLGKPFTHDPIEKEFMDYAAHFNGSTLKSKRKYWRIRNDNNKYLELDMPEPAVVA